MILPVPGDRNHGAVGGYGRGVRIVRQLWRTVRQWFDPSDMRSVGTTPDYRFSLAN